MSAIVTFYSFKGGVGRTMALANIAVLLVRRGLRVLVVDWDLEAPGLDRYFSGHGIQSDKEGAGLLDLLLEAYSGPETDQKPDWRKYLSYINIDNDKQLLLLTSGLQDEMYASKVLGFNWNAFFAFKEGGAFIESLREDWLKEFDLVLIDSRTGITDSGGVCTIQLPDILVPVFTANDQSLKGAKAIALKAQRERQNLAYDRMPLLIFPLLSRFDSRTEYQEARNWLKNFEEELGVFYNDWLPKQYSPMQMLERTKLPYIAYFSFGEKLPVMTEGVTDPEGLGYAYLTAATLIGDEFKGAEKLLASPPVSAVDKSPSNTTDKTWPNALSGQMYTNYEYDVFISYPHTQLYTEWILIVVNKLSMWLTEYLGRPPMIFMDKVEFGMGEQWPLAIRRALLTSKCLVSFTSVTYFRSAWCRTEWETFRARERILDYRTMNSPQSLIAPISLAGAIEHFPHVTKEYVMRDWGKYFLSSQIFWKSELALQLEEHIRRLASELATIIEKAPSFDPNWPVITVQPDEEPVPSSFLKPPALEHEL